MDALIETLSLGPAIISENVIEYFIEYRSGVRY